MNDQITEFLTEHNNEIDFILRKFDGRKNINQISQWLNNFESEDYLYALEMLKHLEYISEEDLYSYCETLISNVTIDFGGEKIFIYPIGKYGKSSTMLLYYLKKCATFSKLEKADKIEIISNISDLRTFIAKKDDMFIYFDDFFGTGNSLIEAIDLVNTIAHTSLKNIKNRKALSLFYMDEAKLNLKINKFDIQVIGYLHQKLFFFDETAPKFSTLTSTDFHKKKSIEIIKNKKLGIKGNLNQYYPLGYGNSEAFITFAYLTPNNTLPIIWSNKNKWRPIFSRNFSSIDQIFLEKKCDVMSISMSNHFGIRANESIMFRFQQTTFFLSMILLMLKKKTPAVNAIKILGINAATYDTLIRILKSSGYITDKNEINDAGEKQISTLLKELKKIESEKLNEFSTFEEVLYVPKSLS